LILSVDNMCIYLSRGIAYAIDLSLHCQFFNGFVLEILTGVRGGGLKFQI
jgi:hypothetical protein